MLDSQMRPWDAAAAQEDLRIDHERRRSQAKGARDALAAVASRRPKRFTVEDSEEIQKASAQLDKATALLDRAGKELETMREIARELDAEATVAEVAAAVDEGSSRSATKARDKVSGALRNVEDAEHKIEIKDRAVAVLRERIAPLRAEAEATAIAAEEAAHADDLAAYARAFTPVVEIGRRIYLREAMMRGKSRAIEKTQPPLLPTSDLYRFFEHNGNGAENPIARPDSENSDQF